MKDNKKIKFNLTMKQCKIYALIREMERIRNYEYKLDNNEKHYKRMLVQLEIETNRKDGINRTEKLKKEYEKEYGKFIENLFFKTNEYIIR